MIKKIGIIVGAALVLAVLGAVLVFLLDIRSKVDELSLEKDAERPPREIVYEPERLGPLFSLETFIVNLSDEGARRYLRVTMDLELEEPKISEQFAQRLPQIRDIILMILPEKTVSELQTTIGKEELRKDISDQINRLFQRQVVKRIYFTEFVIQ